MLIKRTTWHQAVDCAAVTKEIPWSLVLYKAVNIYDTDISIHVLQPVKGMSIRFVSYTDLIPNCCANRTTTRSQSLSTCIGAQARSHDLAPDSPNFALNGLHVPGSDGNPSRPAHHSLLLSHQEESTFVLHIVGNTESRRRNQELFWSPAPSKASCRATELAEPHRTRFLDLLLFGYGGELNRLPPTPNDVDNQSTRC